MRDETLWTEPSPIAEVGALLARGLVRLKARQSSELARDGGESSLDCVAHQSGDPNPETERMTDG